MQWLTAVELGLLKGGHPLLKDIDVSIDPLKGLSLVEGDASNRTTKISKFLKLNAVNGNSVGEMDGMLEDGDITASRTFRSILDTRKELGEVNEQFQVVKDGGLQPTRSIDVELVNGEDENSMNSESGQALQSAKVVMNMLDVTMPGVLTEDRKTKVVCSDIYHFCCLFCHMVHVLVIQI